MLDAEFLSNVFLLEISQLYVRPSYLGQHLTDVFSGCHNLICSFQSILFCDCFIFERTFSYIRNIYQHFFAQERFIIYTCIAVYSVCVSISNYDICPD